MNISVGIVQVILANNKRQKTRRLTRGVSCDMFGSRDEMTDK